MQGTLICYPHQASAARVAVVELLDPRQLLSAAAPASSVSVQSGPPPTVSGVYVAGSQWAQPAKDWLASVGLGSAQYGLRPSSTTAWDFPWGNLDQVTVVFSTDVVVDAADLTVRGVRIDYPIASVEYDVFDFFGATRGVATWTLSRPLGRLTSGDRVTIEVNGEAPDGVRDRVSHELIDGDRNGVAGGDYLQSFAVLPGDVAGDLRVNAIDVAEVKRVLGRSYGDGHTGGGSYDTWADVNADGRINALDVAAVKRNLGTSLPPATAPSAGAAALAPTITGELFASDPILPG